MKFGVFAAALVLSSVSAFASPKAAPRTAACPDFDIQGIWDNTHGQKFEIKQQGCKVVSFARVVQKNESSDSLNLSQPIVFTMDGNTLSNMSPKLFKGLSDLKGSTKQIFEETLTNQKIYTSLHPAKATQNTSNFATIAEPQISIIAQGEMPVPGTLPESAHIFTYTYQATLRPGNWGFSTVLAKDGKWEYKSSRIDKLVLQTEKFAFNDYKRAYGEPNATDTFSVVYGANLILKIVAPMIEAELVRVK